MKKDAGVITIGSTIRSPWSVAGYKKIARHILGGDYNLSIVLVGAQRAKKLNERYRNKSYVPNVLTFPISPGTGEVFLTIPKIKKEAHKYELTPEGHAKFLLIHGCLHLKGYSHGSTMEGAEHALLKAFHIR